MKTDHFDIHQHITAEIVSAVENAAGAWRMPWHHDGSSISRPKNVASDKGYRGINVLALWVAARRIGCASGVWGTYPQWVQAGCQVRKDERATTVVFWKQMRKNDSGDAESEGAAESCARFVARGYRVFNASQVDGYAPHDLATPARGGAYRARRGTLSIAELAAMARGPVVTPSVTFCFMRFTNQIHKEL